MATKHADIFTALAAPFESNEVKVRSAAGGRQLHYVTARTVMNRLDSVLGPEHWWDDFFPGENSVLCRLTVRLPDGSTLTKCDAGGYAGMADQGDDDKSGYSDAFKRAAVKFGVSRYLYRDGVPDFVADRLGEGSVPPPEPQAGPATPRPDRSGPAPDRQPAPQAQQGQPQGQRWADGNPPRTGKALFSWVKDMEQRYEVGLLKYLNQFGKLQEFPGRMIDWDQDMVKLAYEESCRKLKQVEAEGVGSQ